MSVSTFHPVADTQLDLGNASTNYGSEPSMILSAYVGAVFLRGLWRFDLTSPISGSPIVAGSTINNSVLTLTGGEKAEKTINPALVHFYRGQRAWVEAQATANDYATGQPWTSEPGDPDTGLEAEEVTETEGGVGLTVSCVLITADAVASRGLIAQIVGINTDEGSLGLIFDSREGTVQPLLTVDWTAPASLGKRIPSRTFTGY